MDDKIIAAARACGFTSDEGAAFRSDLSRFYVLAYRQGLEDAAKVVEERRAYESSAAAHHAGSWQPAFEFHTTRHAAMVDALESIRALKEKDHA